MALVDKYGPSLLRVAMMYVSSRAVAEEVVADTWLAVYTGLERFEGRSSLKTWLFRILTNKAKTRGVRESRTLPVLVVHRRRRRGGHGGRRRPLQPRRRLELSAARCPRRAPARRRGAPDGGGGNRGAPREPAGGHHPPRRRGLVGRGGVQRSRALRDKPTSAAPSGPRKSAGRVRAVPGERMSPVARDLACQEIVEIVTDYLEGAMDPASAGVVRGASLRLPTLHALPGADARDDPGCGDDYGGRSPAGPPCRVARGIPQLQALGPLDQTA